ncbi:hypothetical protein FRC15_000655 [Serendipita sp. 397]|nr:hypothetical protein FRC15_000655 [Serendipita sp. 397]KAG8791028.1 hypothetical protein FRC16_000625 [Serendipita sp. 398]
MPLPLSPLTLPSTKEGAAATCQRRQCTPEVVSIKPRSISLDSLLPTVFPATPLKARPRAPEGIQFSNYKLSNAVMLPTKKCSEATSNERLELRWLHRRMRLHSRITSIVRLMF